MRARALRQTPFLLGVVLMLLACVGLDGPTAVGAPAWKGLDLVVCLDVSRSMLARDVTPDRLGRAKREIAALAEHAAGDRIGLVLFAGEARLRVPRTRDGASLAEMAARAGPWDVGRGGTDLASAVTVALGALKGREGQGAIVILSDGGDFDPTSMATAVGALRRDGVAVFALGLGSARGAKIPTERGAFVTDAAGEDVVTALNATGLRRLADATGGSYQAQADGGLADFYDSHVLPSARQASSDHAAEARSPATWFLVLALVCFFVDLAWVARKRRRIRAAALALVVLGLVPACGGAPVEDSEARAMFLKGNRAFAESLALEAEGSKDPEAMKAAYRRAEDALAAWQWAAATRLDWPEARRNVERGLLRMAALREHKRDDGKQKPPPKPPPPEVDEPEDPRPDSLTKVASTELPSGGVLRILDTLRLRERQKIDLRKARRTRRPAAGGRDW